MKLSLLVTIALSAILSFVCAQESDIANRTWDKLSYDGKILSAGKISRPMTPDEISHRYHNQLTLCMIGDSITWAQHGDFFRREMLRKLPELVFEGTHSAALGYSHAGEGGDSSYRVLRRIHDRNRIPDAPYYHLMIGINDASAARKDLQSAAVAAEAVERIVKIVNLLLERPGTRKVFLGSILPGPFSKNGSSTVRDRTGSMINRMLREDFCKFFPHGNVVWIEYEKPLRAKVDIWKSRKFLKGAHPTRAGYRWIAGIAARTLKKHMLPEKLSGSGRAGVMVTNLWQKNAAQSLPLIPGWYTLSMEPERSGEVAFTLYSVTSDPKSRFKKTYTLSGEAGKRVEVHFMTGYQNYGYTEAPFKLEITAGTVRNIMIEKSRPLRKASCYGVGSFVDTVSAIAPGERIVREP